mgnify:CR=1 FL=1
MIMKCCKKTIKEIFCIKIILVVFFFSTSAMAAENGRAEVYKVTMTRVELCTNSTCTTPTAVCTTTKTVDIASVSAGENRYTIKRIVGHVMEMTNNRLNHIRDSIKNK